MNPSDTSSSAAQIQRELSSTLSSADASTAQSIQNLQLVHQARLSRLSREAATAKAQYGAKSPEAQQAEAAVVATTATVARVSMLNLQMTTPAPQVSQTGWALHGRVFNAQLQPVSGYTVFLVDAEKNYQQAYGFAYTDATGYFLLNYAGSTGAKTRTQSRSRLAPSQAATPAQLFIEVANAKAQPVYLSTSAFQPAAGSATYQNVVLPSGEQPIGDPPDFIRKVAMPSETG
ncbi:MAG TPA: hypothetical protein VH639_14190 [Bryobacteraceae bacterium]|jgi:hypothetical protein